ncbi:WD domain, G-beta repeat [Stieleria neptunia]|uniref:WD domain, G-beta repeat n=1 Tax=Stieleria neptunia TaxID=2527979 RepID=A0A518HQR0_9BACT|nr:WD40 repeat domain-containing protein [Stieleria neptunia]QDV43189.1 WD domain, G-beta repeat [Stieleria neptunia]
MSQRAVSQDASSGNAVKPQETHAENASQRCPAGLSRRSMLTAAAFGGAIAGLGRATSGWATEPQTPVAAGLSAKPAVERITQTSEREIVRLKRVSSDFGQTIVRAIASDPRGELIAVAGDDHAIRIMETTRLDVLATLQGHTDLIQSLHFDPAGNLLVSAGNDGQLIIWNRDDSFREFHRIQRAPALACVRFSPDGQEIAAVGFENKVHLFGRTKDADQPQAECDCTDLRAVDYSSDGKLLAVAGRSGYLHLFDRETNKLIDNYWIHNGRIRDLKFNASSPVVVTAGEDGSVVMFDTDVKKTVGRIQVTSGKLFSVCILDHQHLVVAGSDNIIRIVNVSLGRVVEKLSGHKGSIAALASSGNALFSGGYDATLRRWELGGFKAGRERIAERNNPIDR